MKHLQINDEEILMRFHPDHNTEEQKYNKCGMNMNR